MHRALKRMLMSSAITVGVIATTASQASAGVNLPNHSEPNTAVVGRTATQRCVKGGSVAARSSIVPGAILVGAPIMIAAPASASPRDIGDDWIEERSPEVTQLTSPTMKGAC